MKEKVVKETKDKAVKEPKEIKEPKEPKEPKAKLIKGSIEAKEKMAKIRAFKKSNK